MKFGKKKLSYNFENVRMWGGGGEEKKNKKGKHLFREMQDQKEIRGVRCKTGNKIEDYRLREF